MHHIVCWLHCFDSTKMLALACWTNELGSTVDQQFSKFWNFLNATSKGPSAHNHKLGYKVVKFPKDNQNLAILHCSGRKNLSDPCVTQGRVNQKRHREVYLSTNYKCLHSLCIFNNKEHLIVDHICIFSTTEPRNSRIMAWASNMADVRMLTMVLRVQHSFSVSREKISCNCYIMPFRSIAFTCLMRKLVQFWPGC